MANESSINLWTLSVNNVRSEDISAIAIPNVNGVVTPEKLDRAYAQLSGDTFTGSVTVSKNNKSITFDGEKIYRQDGSASSRSYLFPSTPGTLVTTQQVNASLQNYLPLSGGNLSGNIYKDSPIENPLCGLWTAYFDHSNDESPWWKNIWLGVENNRPCSVLSALVDKKHFSILASRSNEINNLEYDIKTFESQSYINGGRWDKYQWTDGSWKEGLICYYLFYKADGIGRIDIDAYYDSRLSPGPNGDISAILSTEELVAFHFLREVTGKDPLFSSGEQTLEFEWNYDIENQYHDEGRLRKSEIGTSNYKLLDLSKGPVLSTCGDKYLSTVVLHSEFVTLTGGNFEGPISAGNGFIANNGDNFINYGLSVNADTAKAKLEELTSNSITSDSIESDSAEFNSLNVSAENGANIIGGLNNGDVIIGLSSQQKYSGQDKNVVIGNGAKSISRWYGGNVAIGDSVSANGESIAIGSHADANYVDVAIGPWTKANPGTPDLLQYPMLSNTVKIVDPEDPVKDRTGSAGNVAIGGSSYISAANHSIVIGTQANVIPQLYDEYVEDGKLKSNLFDVDGNRAYRFPKMSFNADDSIAIGTQAHVYNDHSIQLGTGENHMISAMQVYNWPLLDIRNGNIPKARLSANALMTFGGFLSGTISAISKNSRILENEEPLRLDADFNPNAKLSVDRIMISTSDFYRISAWQELPLAEKIAHPISAKIEICGITYKDENSTITFPGGTYDLESFYAEGFEDCAVSCDLDSGFRFEFWRVQEGPTNAFLQYPYFIKQGIEYEESFDIGSINLKRPTSYLVTRDEVDAVIADEKFVHLSGDEVLSDRLYLTGSELASKDVKNPYYKKYVFCSSAQLSDPVDVYDVDPWTQFLAMSADSSTTTTIVRNVGPNLSGMELSDIANSYIELTADEIPCEFSWDTNGEQGYLNFHWKWYWKYLDGTTGLGSLIIDSHLDSSERTGSDSISSLSQQELLRKTIGVMFGGESGVQENGEVLIANFDSDNNMFLLNYEGLDTTGTQEEILNEYLTKLPMFTLNERILGTYQYVKHHERDPFLVSSDVFESRAELVSNLKASINGDLAKLKPFDYSNWREPQLSALIYNVGILTATIQHVADRLAE